MPPRRSHKKSRAGCRRCKARRIKCDEEHPKCGKCRQHGIPCDFESPGDAEHLLPPTSPLSIKADLAAPSAIAYEDAPTSYQDAPTPPVLWPGAASPHQAPTQPPSLFTIPLDIPPPSNRLMELRLLHQYTYCTCRTLTVHAPSAVTTWQEAVPRLAFSTGGAGTYLADSMLAVAALHLRTLYPHDMDLVRASHAYMASSLSQYRAALQRGIDDSNAEALFLTATLISFLTTASRIFLDEDEAFELERKIESKTLGNRRTLPLSWFYSFQGVKTIVSASWSRIRCSNAVRAVIDSQPVLRLDLDAADSLPELSFFGHLLEGVDDELAEEESEAVAMGTRHAYLHAVAVLNWAHASPYRTAALAFPATVAKRFVDLVEMLRPRALAVLACFFALLKRLEGVWWLSNVVRREVLGLVSLFELQSPWLPHLAWPTRIALLESDVLSVDIWGSDCVANESMFKSSVDDGLEIQTHGDKKSASDSYAGSHGHFDVDDVDPVDSVYSHIEIIARMNVNSVEPAEKDNKHIDIGQGSKSVVIPP